MVGKAFLASILPAVLVWSVLISGGATPVEAQAASPAPGPTGPTVQAVAYSPITPGASFETQANDDTELNQEALDLVNTQLASRGYSVADQSQLVMVVETDLVRGQQQDDPLGQASANNKEAQIQARIFSSNQNSLLNPQQPLGSADRIYRISLAVYDRGTGVYVWRGSAMRNNPDVDIPKANHEMIPELIRYLGQSVQPAGPQP